MDGLALSKVCYWYHFPPAVECDSQFHLTVRLLIFDCQAWLASAKRASTARGRYTTSNMPFKAVVSLVLSLVCLLTFSWVASCEWKSVRVLVSDLVEVYHS